MHRTFVADPAALRDAREFLRGAIKTQVDGATLADAEIIVSELATNAVLHARSPFRVTLTIEADRIRIAVRDSSFAPAVFVAPGDVLIGGRGVQLVATLSRAWGIDAEPDGKTVWAELARTAPTSR